MRAGAFDVSASPRDFGERPQAAYPTRTFPVCGLAVFSGTSEAQLYGA